MNRQDKRIGIQDAFLIIDSQDDKKNYTVHNISRGGLRFSSNETFEIDLRINVTVYHEKSQIHQAKGRICYFLVDGENNNGIYYGLSFLDNYLKID